MKDLKKKILSGLIALQTVAAGLSVSANVPADVVGTGFEDPIQILAALGVMVGDGNGEFRPNDSITRSEVAKIAIHAMGLDDAANSSAGATKFPDVSSDFWATGYINLATSMGIVIGDDKGNFRPQDSITYAEAMTIMVRATGFEPSATTRGGFPSGYVLVGSENGLAKNVTGTTNTPISRGNVAYLTVNALKSKMMEQTNFGDSPKYEIVDKTLLSDRLKVTESNGQVIATSYSTLTGPSSLSDGQVRIDETNYDTDYNMNNLLGFNVNYYVKDFGNGDERIILALPTKEKNSSITITASLFDKLTTQNTNKAISYFKNETTSKTDTAEISSNAALIYNGKYEAMTDELLNLDDKSGQITLLDTDKDGKYDVVFVTNYYNIFVDQVTSTGKIVDKYNQKTIQLNEDVTYNIIKGLEAIEVKDIVEYDVLSVAESKDNKLFDVQVSNATVTGRITALNDDGYTINSKVYKAANNYTDELKIGTEATFYLDIEGKIAGTDTQILLSTNYGYLTKAYSVENEDLVKFKIFTKEGSEKTIEGADKIKLNGASAQDAVKVLNAMKSEDVVAEQLITYKLNSDEKISEINTAVDNSSTGNVNKSQFTLNYKLEDAVFNNTLKTLGNIKLNDKTVIFDIPENSSSSDYSIADIKMFEDEQKYDILVFDREDDYTAKAIVVTNALFQTNADSKIAIVKELAQGTNESDEISDILVALIDGKEEKFFAESDSVLVKGDKKLEEGDIIQIKQNSNGEIASIRLLQDIATKATEAEKTPAENLKTVYGKVSKKFADSINVTVGDGSARNYQITSDVLVYSVDTTVSKNKVTVGEFADVESFDADENNRVFLKIYKDTVQEIVIIK